MGRVLNGVARAGKGRAAGGELDVARVRRDFPILRTKFGDTPLVYLDNASTAHKPKVVIDRIGEFYAKEYAKTNAPYRMARASS